MNNSILLHNFKIVISFVCVMYATKLSTFFLCSLSYLIDEIVVEIAIQTTGEE